MEQNKETRPWDLLKKNNYTDDETANMRLNICLGCEHLLKNSKICKKCGCFMQAKTKLKLATCPIKKW
jgi:hypothetical protein